MISEEDSYQTSEPEEKSELGIIDEQMTEEAHGEPTPEKGKPEEDNPEEQNLIIDNQKTYNTYEGKPQPEGKHQWSRSSWRFWKAKLAKKREHEQTQQNYNSQLGE